MIRARVTIYDDETGQILDKDKEVPCLESWCNGISEHYLFEFEYARLGHVSLMGSKEAADDPEHNNPGI